MLKEDDFDLFFDRACSGVGFATLAQRRGLKTSAGIQQRFHRICRILIGTYNLHNSTCHQRAQNAFAKKREQMDAPPHIDDLRVIECLDLSVRSYNALRHANIETLDQLSRTSVYDLMKIKYCGVVSVEEIYAEASKRGIKIPMGKIRPELRARFELISAALDIGAM